MISLLLSFFLFFNTYASQNSPFPKVKNKVTQTIIGAARAFYTLGKIVKVVKR